MLLSLSCKSDKAIGVYVIPVFWNPQHETSTCFLAIESKCNMTRDSRSPV